MPDAPPRSFVRRFANGFDKFARVATKWTGSTTAFVLALLTVVLWAVLGPAFRYSDTWQLVINTGTTIVTFLMVFLIQRSQNRDSIAVQLKLNELIAAVKGASNRLIAIEEMSEDDILTLHERFQKLAMLAKNDRRPGITHSIEEVEKEAVAVVREHVKAAVQEGIEQARNATGQGNTAP